MERRYSILYHSSFMDYRLDGNSSRRSLSSSKSHAVSWSRCELHPLMLSFVPPSDFVLPCPHNCTSLLLLSCCIAISLRVSGLLPPISFAVVRFPAGSSRGLHVISPAGPQGSNACHWRQRAVPARLLDAVEIVSLILTQCSSVF